MRRIYELDFLPGCRWCQATIEAEVSNTVRAEGTTRIVIKATTTHNHPEAEMLPGWPPHKPQDEPQAEAAGSPTAETASEAPDATPVPAAAQSRHPTTLFEMPSPYAVGGLDTQLL